MKTIKTMINAMASRWRNRVPPREKRAPGRMKFVPTVVHNSPNLGDRFERWSSQLFAEACCY